MDLSTVNYRSVAYCADDRCLNCEIEHPTYGWIPFTASLDDAMDYGPVIYNRIQDAISLGTVTPAPYVPPEPPATLTTEQKIARAGFTEGELVDYLVEKIQLRLNE